MERLPNSLNVSFVESLYQDFLRDPKSVPADWRAYFEQLDGAGDFHPRSSLGPSFRPASIFNPLDGDRAPSQAEAQGAALQDRVSQLIRNYRVRGHIVACIDPLER